MTWTVRAQRREAIVDITVTNPDGGGPIGPFVIRLHPPITGPIRVDRIPSGNHGPTVSVTDPAFQVLYVTAELLNKVELTERIRSTEVSR